MKSLLFIFGLVVLAACSQSTVEPVVTSVETKPAVTASAEELAKGKTLYETNCVKCHRLFTPSEFTEKKWHHEVPEMSEKAKVNKETENLILAYVLSGAKK